MLITLALKFYARRLHEQGRDAFATPLPRGWGLTDSAGELAPFRFTSLRRAYAAQRVVREELDRCAIEPVAG